ncbi:unnamed protein product [Ectocarpus sp. 4 AP-2014]
MVEDNGNNHQGSLLPSEDQGAGVIEHRERKARKGGAPRHKRRLATFVSLASTADEDDVGLKEGEGAQPLAGLVWVGQHEAQAYRVNLALRQDQDAVGGHLSRCLHGDSGRRLFSTRLLCCGYSSEARQLRGG